MVFSQQLFGIRLFGISRGGGSHTVMRIKAYVGATVATAAALSVTVYRLAPQVHNDEAQAAISFAVLGVLFQLGAYRKAPKGATGSIAFLPFLAAIVLSPNWIALAAVGVAMAACELLGRKPPIKLVFNVSQVIVSAAISLLAYRYLGGTSVLRFAPALIPAVAVALPLYLIVNTLASYGAVAISTGSRYWSLIAARTTRRIFCMICSRCRSYSCLPGSMPSSVRSGYRCSPSHYLVCGSSTGLTPSCSALTVSCLI